jgi:ankyrin repeat protein
LIILIDFLPFSLGATPLSYAIYGCGSTSVVRFLLDHGAKPNKTNVNGYTALHFAASTGLLPAVLFILPDLFWFILPKTGYDVCPAENSALLFFVLHIILL